MSQKEDLLDQLKAKVAQMDLPLKQTALHLVFGEGDPDTKIVFVGEAPGFHEDQQGRPFVGVAGKLLDQLLTQNRLKREAVYITNMIKYRPPENRDPLPSELAIFGPIVDQQVEIIKPQVVVTLGRFSMNNFLPGAKISIVHGKPASKHGMIILPLYHPAAALRNSNVLKELEIDFQKIPGIMAHPEEVVAEKNIDPNQIGLF